MANKKAKAKKEAPEKEVGWPQPDPVLHLGMNSGALLEFTGKTAVNAYQALNEATRPLVKLVVRPGFEQRVNLDLVETVDWYPNGNLGP